MSVSDAVWLRSCVVAQAARTEYRSAIFYNTPEQAEVARGVTAEVQRQHFDPKGASLSPFCCVRRAGMGGADCAAWVRAQG